MPLPVPLFRLARRLAVLSPTLALTVAPAARAQVAGAPQGVTITPDGRHVFQALSAETRVAIIDPTRRVVLGHPPAGETPDGVAYTTRVVATAAPQR